MPIAKLARRVAAIEKSVWARRAEANAARARLLQQAAYALPQAQLEFLIDAILARAQGRLLTTAETQAEQAYGMVLQQRCRASQRPLPQPADLESLTGHAAMRQLSDEDLRLSCQALRAILSGQQPTQREWETLQALHAISEAQYQRAGFLSKADFQQWWHRVNAPSGTPDGTRGRPIRPGPRTSSALPSNTCYEEEPNA